MLSSPASIDPHRVRDSLLAALAPAAGSVDAVALGVHAVFTTAATATWTVLVGDTAVVDAFAPGAADGGRRSDGAPQR